MSIAVAIIEALAKESAYEDSVDYLLNESIEDESIEDSVVRHPEASSYYSGDSRWIVNSPTPVFCDLPRERPKKPIEVWGFARTLFAVYGDEVSIALAEVLIDTPRSSRKLPTLGEAVANAGTLYCRHPVTDPDLLVKLFRNAAHYRKDQPHAFDIARVVSENSLGIEAFLKKHANQKPRESDATVEGGIRARLVFSNTPTEENAALVHTQKCDVRLADTCVTIRVDTSVTVLPPPPATDEYFLVHVRPDGVFVPDNLAIAFVDLLRNTLAGALAYYWVVKSAQRMNDSYAGLVEMLLKQGASYEEIYKARLRAFKLRSAFINRIAAKWDPMLGMPDGAEELGTCINDSLRLKAIWDREYDRFNGLSSVIDGAGAVPPPPALVPRNQSPREAELAGIRKETNPFVQVRKAIRYRFYRYQQGKKVREQVSYENLAEHLPVNIPGASPPDQKRIEVHPFSNRFALFEEINASLFLTTFMTTTSFLFLGVILNKDTYQSIDVLYLFVAAFSFLFATLIFANASSTLARYNTVSFERQVEIGNRLAEYLGVYPLLLAAPVTITRFLGRGWVSISVACLDIGLFLGYNLLSDASLLERDIQKHAIGTDRWRYGFLISLTTFMITAFTGVLISCYPAQIVGAVGFGIEILVLCGLSTILPERSDQREYYVDDWDVIGEGAPGVYGKPGVYIPRPDD